MKPRISIKPQHLLGVLMILSAFFWSMAESMAQNPTITGTVIDENGETLPGVNILLKGSSTGTITDIEGNYTIDAPAEGTLVFSFIGYQSQEISISGRSKIDITLSSDLENLDEVVVIGYGTRSKGELTGAVATVDKDFLDQQPTGNVSKALQGSTSGITVVNSATPGGQSEIRIRGMGTINNNGPLWVVDGVYGATPPPPNQIESIQVLKDAASTAIYGARGANGVILVTTKSGKAGQPAQVSVSMRTGFNKPNAKFDIMTNPQELGELMWMELENDGLPTSNVHYGSGDNPVLNDYLFPNGGSFGDPSTNIDLYDKFNYPITESNKAGTDWMDVVYQDGSIQDFNLSVTGGGKKTNYAFQGNYLKENGIFKNTSYERISLRSNVDAEINDWLKIGERLGVMFSQNKGYNGNNAHESLLNELYTINPILPVYDIAGNYAGGVVGGNVYDGPNPLGLLERSGDSKNTTYNLTGNIYAELSPIKDLKFKTLFGYNINLSQNFNPRFPDPENTNGTDGTTLNEGSAVNMAWNWSNTLSYTKTINQDHNIDLLAGTEAVKSNYRNIYASRQDYFSTDLNFMVLDAGASNQLNGGNASAWSLFSYFGRAHYDFKKKYIADVTIRRDGSSRFGVNNRFGVFPAVSLGWVLSEENFMSGVDGWLDFLKLRTSWGQSGNDQIGNYNSYSIYNSNPGNSYYAIGGGDNTIVVGYQSATRGNPNAKWETTTSTNIALDATFFGNLDVTMDFWQKNTKDMLFPIAIPLVAGSATPPSVNIGSMSNKGVDITLDYRGEFCASGVTYSLSGNFTHYKNEVTKLSNNANEFIQGFPVRQSVYTRTEPGRSFPEFYGYVVDGIFQTQEEADNHPTNGTYNAPGNLKIKDVNGDGVISPEDRTYIGNPHPDFTTGLRLGLGYKGFDFAATLYASVGNDIANYTSRFIRYGLFQGPNSPDRLYKSWGSPYLEDNADATLPKASNSTSFEQNPSSVYIEDGSYLRLQNLQIGYNFPDHILDRLKINNLRLYFMGSNLFTITGYSGLNPEIPAKRDNGIAREIDRGVDTGAWPVSRQLMFGLNLSL
ncbi:SusC/RagA family TonB-linked outer membrane protein [Echinicola rosea]|nr:TonB-dependent receptor [Echinicola rosea]